MVIKLAVITIAIFDYRNIIDEFSISYEFVADADNRPDIEIVKK